jgi:hypothetical protein
MTEQELAEYAIKEIEKEAYSLFKQAEQLAVAVKLLKERNSLSSNHIKRLSSVDVKLQKIIKLQRKTDSEL